MLEQTSEPASKRYYAINQIDSQETFTSKISRKFFSSKNIKRKLPITEWLPKYTTEDFIGDLIAGITVGFTIVPQGIAYALIAGVPPNHGLYSAFMSPFLYTIFGRCHQNSVGPTAIMSLLTYEYSGGGNTDIAILLSFTSGIIILLFGLFNLGVIIAFLSKPVISGFTSAAAILIATSQLKGLFGLKIKAEGLLDTWVKVFQHIQETRMPDFILGFVSIIVLLIMRKIKDLKRFKPKEDDSTSQKIIKKVVFFSSVGRNAIVVIIGSVIAGCLDSNQPFTITGDITPGLPRVQLPSFTMNNGTTSFLEIMSEAGTGVFVIPLIAILETIAVVSSFSQGKPIDAKQEIIALGVCNLAGSFVQSITTTGGFSRSAVNESSGVRTPGGGIITGIIVLLALAVLTPYFRIIPQPSLAAVIICSIIFLIKYEDIVPIWRVRKADQLVLWVSLLVCIFWKLEYGIILGVLVNLTISILHYANPKVDVFPHVEIDSIVPPHVVVEPRLGLLYFNVDRLRSRVIKAGLREAKGVYPVVVNCSHFSVIDYSGSKGMQSLCMDFAGRGQILLFMNVSPGIIKSLKALSKDIRIIEEENLAETLKDMCEAYRSKTSSICIEDSKFTCDNGVELKNALPLTDF